MSVGKSDIGTFARGSASIMRGSGLSRISMDYTVFSKAYRKHLSSSSLEVKLQKIAASIFFPDCEENYHHGGLIREEALRPYPSWLLVPALIVRDNGLGVLSHVGATDKLGAIWQH